MAKQSLAQIKNWFRTRLKPTQAQFWDTWDSFWHKDEMIPTAAIENLNTILASKATNERVDNVEQKIDDLAEVVANLEVPDAPVMDDFIDNDDIGWNVEDNREIQAHTIGFTGTFLNPDGKIVTVENGLIKSVAEVEEPPVVDPDELLLTFSSLSTSELLNNGSVSDWNTFFDLPANGTPFTKMVRTGNVFNLIGATEIYLQDALFQGKLEGTFLLKVEDTLNCIKTGGESCFGGCLSLSTAKLHAIESIGYEFLGDCTSLVDIDILSLITAGNYFLSGCSSLTDINCPSLISIGNDAIRGCNSLQSINIPLCTNIGDTPGSNWGFVGTTGNVIELTIPASLMTCNDGAPDADIQYLIDNNTVTITEV